MSSRKIILLVVALLIAGITVILARSMMGGNGDSVQAQQAKPTVQILVADKDLPAGTLIKEADMRWQSWPEESLLEDYIVKGKGDKNTYLGDVVRYGLHAGEPFSSGRIAKPGESGFMAAALKPGMRAVSISISPVAGVAGFVFPGDFVDVIVTHKVDSRNGLETSARQVSETILRNVRVLALDQKMSDEVQTPKVAQIATLEVTSKQAEAVALGAQMGHISLALRSMAIKTSEDPATEKGIVIKADTEEETRGLTWDSDVSSVLPRPANRLGATRRVTIIRGKEITNSVYDLTSPEGAKE